LNLFFLFFSLEMAAGRIAILLALAVAVRGAAALGPWTAGASSALTPLSRGSSGADRACAGRLDADERLREVQARLRRSSAAAGAWIMAKKEKILTEEEIYAEKVRKLARSIDQVPGCRVLERRAERDRGFERTVANGRRQSDIDAPR
jgi:hypothetical protein